MTVQQQTAELPAQRRGHRWSAATYDVLIGPGERRLFSKVRSRLLDDLSGRVLEVGAGTGLNFPHYAAAVHIVSTEPDPFMRERAQRRAIACGREDIEVHDASVERLPFDDASFDHVVATLVFCTVPDAARGLAEIRRVLRPGGTIRFLEHVRNDESRFWGGFQDRIVSPWRWVGAGCNPNRRTQQAIERAGFGFDWIERADTWFGKIYGVARPTDQVSERA